MASNSRINRALNGPGVFEVTLGAILSISLGVLLASLYLVFKPVIIVSKLPATSASSEEYVVSKQRDTQSASEVYFVEGATNGSKARQWVRKQQLLSEGNAADVVLSEEELNAWVASVTAKVQPGASTLVTPEKVNFRIQKGVLQIGIQAKLNAFEIQQAFVIQARGQFVPGANGFEYRADELYIGSLPVHAIPGLPALIIQRVLAAQNVPDDLKANWQKLKLVAVEDSSLHIIVL
jgi:hypothetical protein